MILNQLFAEILKERAWLEQEHCLVGAKIRPERAASFPRASPLPGAQQPYYASHAAGVPPPLPSWVHEGIGADVIVSEVRDTSRKPDELYGIIERLCPGGRKVELFGRKHNTRRGWLTLGNQLKGNCVVSECRLLWLWMRCGTLTLSTVNWIGDVTSVA